ncbi:protein translocase subunit SecF [Patescibacteria group bacterium]|nr:protein translocase subunit SecF [Patescibacteria group bacterium]
MINFVKHKQIFFYFSGTLLLISVLSLFSFGLNLGIDFLGGSMLEIKYLEESPTVDEVRDKVADFDDLGEIKIQATKNNGFILRFKNIDQQTHQDMLDKLGKVEEQRFESIGPVIGEQAAKNARWAITLALLAVILYVAWAFRKLARISSKKESWKYGAGALLALFHDVLILLGFFAIFNHFNSSEINIDFIIAILTVLGYSINDTIVIYDRIRENLLSFKFKHMAEAINSSLNETIVRSLNTSLTTLLVLLVLYLFGGESMKNFVLAMMVGIGIGTYSSIAIASQFLLFKRK